MPVLAECGSYLYLLKELEDENGTGYEMAGVFSGKGFKKGKIPISVILQWKQKVTACI